MKKRVSTALNEGHAALRALNKTGKEIARDLEVSGGMVSMVLAGTRQTSPDLRRKMQDVYGIPVEAWSKRCAGAGPAPSREPARHQRTKLEGYRAFNTSSDGSLFAPEPEPEPTAPSVTSVQVTRVPAAPQPDEIPVPHLDVDDPLGTVRSLVEHAQRRLHLRDLTPTEYKAVNAQLLDAMKVADQLQDRHTATQTKLAQHPMFLDLVRELTDALAEFPEALAAATKVLNAPRKA